MKYLYRFFSVGFFLASPATLIASVWLMNWRLFFISAIVLIFSAFSASMAALYEKNEKQEKALLTVEDMFASLDKQHLDDLEEK